MTEDFNDLNKITPTKRFCIDLAKVRLVFDREHKPFDEPCARLEFTDELERLEKESERRHGFIKMDTIKFDFGDLKRFGDEKLFEFIDEQPHMQDKVVEGTRTQILTGYIRNYRCKKRGHGISVFIPASDYKPEVKKEK